MEVDFAEADDFGSHFDEFIVFDIFQSSFEEKRSWRLENDVLVIAGGANVGQLLFAARIYDQVVIASVFADDHAFVNFVIGRNKKL